MMDKFIFDISSYFVRIDCGFDWNDNFIWRQKIETNDDKMANKHDFDQISFH